MLRYLLLRAGQTVLVMWLVATTTFFLFRVLPGDPAAITLGVDATEESRAAIRHEMGLDRPLFEQYLTWLGRLLRGDLGVAYAQGRQPVADLLGGPLLRTLELAVIATVIAIVISIPLAKASASRPGSVVDQLSRALAIVGFSLPSFWLGILLLLLFSQALGWFPAGGYVPFAESPIGYIRSVTLPAVAVSVILAGIFIRFLRASMLEALGQDYIRTAQAKGVTERRVSYQHALRNALLPFVTIVGMQFGLLVGGLVVVEQVFNWPGIGLLMVQAILSRSYDLVQGAVLITALTFVVVNTLVDISYRVIDPRITHA